jgi:uncharacterized protein YjiS (DUF1127 family)
MVWPDRLHLTSFFRKSEAQIANLSKEIAMTILNITPHSATTTSAIRRKLGLFLNRLGRLINHSIAAAIAHRARQADIVILRRLSDRELKDIGLTRGDIGEGLAEAARCRIRMQQIERSRANWGTSNR